MVARETEGHAIQATFAEASLKPVAGWKIEARAEAKQGRTSSTWRLTAPLAGRVLMDGLLPDQVTLDLAAQFDEGG